MAQKAVRGHKRALKLENYAPDCYLLLNSMGEDGDSRDISGICTQHPAKDWAGQWEIQLRPPGAMFSSEMEAEGLPSSKTVLAPTVGMALPRLVEHQEKLHDPWSREPHVSSRIHLRYECPAVCVLGCKVC